MARNSSFLPVLIHYAVNKYNLPITSSINPQNAQFLSYIFMWQLTEFLHFSILKGPLSGNQNQIVLIKA